MNRLKPFVSWPMFCMTIVMAALLIACSGPDSEGVEPAAMLQTPALASVADTPTPVVTLAAPEATDTPPKPTRVLTTGIPEVDRAVAVVLSNNLQARRDLIQFTTASCTHELVGMGGPPKCEPGQPEGTPVEYFPVLGPGEGEHIHPDSIDRMLDFDAGTLYAVYRRTEQSVLDQYFPSGNFGLIFTTGQLENDLAYVLVHMGVDGKIVRIDYVVQPLELIIEQESGEFLVAPPPEPLSDSRWVDGTPTPTPHLSLNSEQNPVPTMTPSLAPGLSSKVTELTRPLYFLSKDHVTSSGTGKPQGVWRLDPGSTVVELITPPELNITSFDLWLGDGRMAYGTSTGQIYFVMPDGQNRLLYDAGFEDGETVQISSVAWSPEGERLAFTSLFGHPTIAGQSDGLWLLTLGVDEPVKLLSNRHLDPIGDNVNEYRAVSVVDWAPDGSALLLKGSFWEYSDILWLDPIIPDPDEANLHDPPTAWSDGSWTNDSRSILLSGLNRGVFSHLDRANKVTEGVNRLLEGEIVKLGILKAQELPAGIAFLARESSLEDATKSYRLYLGHQLDGEFQYAPAGPDHAFCNSGYVWDISWDPEGHLAAVSCDRGVQLISIDGTIEVDLTPLLEPSVGENLLKVYWGQT